jgi:hypothetical protein
MPNVNYDSRNFVDIRTDLINYVKQYYPDIYADYNDASVGQMLIDLNAAVGDMLSHNTDRMFAETQIDYAQERHSLLSLARTFGLNIPNKRASSTIVDVSITIPVFGDTFDVSYAPLLRAGSQFNGAGKVFELLYDTDFSSPFNKNGIPNRIVIPNINANGTVLNYTLTKREMVVNGATKIFKRVLTTQDVIPFLEIILPDNNVTEVLSCITLPGTNLQGQPTNSQFNNSNIRWYEMSSLSEDKVFITDNNRVTQNTTVTPGKWMSTSKKFIKEYTDLGFTKITFGAGSQNISSLCDFNVDPSLVNQIGNFINNMALGEIHTANTTLFIKYRIGGGSDTNVGPNTITNLGLLDMVINGPSATINQSVKKTLKVNNILPAVGGKDAPTVEEIRYMVKYNFASQNRAVTIKDYQTRVAQMPGNFGTPFRNGIFEDRNKIAVYILTLDRNGRLSNESNTTLKENISNYLADYRMLNDYVHIKDGRIINLAFDYDVMIDTKVPQSQIISEIINKTKEYMDINKFDMGDNIYLSPLIEVINNIGGVLNVTNVSIYNKVGENKYSLNEISQPYLDDETRLIDVSADYTLFGEPTSMFEIKFPTDIRVRVK